MKVKRGFYSVATLTNILIITASLHGSSGNAQAQTYMLKNLNHIIKTLEHELEELKQQPVPVGRKALIQRKKEIADKKARIESTKHEYDEVARGGTQNRV
jgi:hypothetical protein